MVPRALRSRGASSTWSAATARLAPVLLMHVAAGAFASSAEAPPCTASALQPSWPTTRTLRAGWPRERS
eukprot:3005783-Pyramimonas_sp.AAC.1